MLLPVSGVHGIKPFGGFQVLSSCPPSRCFPCPVQCRDGGECSLWHLSQQTQTWSKFWGKGVSCFLCFCPSPSPLSCLFPSIHSMNFQKYFNPSQSSIIFSVYLVLLSQSFTYLEYEKGICGVWWEVIDNIRMSAEPQKLTFPPLTVAAFLHSSSSGSFLTNFETVCISYSDCCP